MPTENKLALLRLLQLVSPAMPIGMYSYSQGMEKAVEEGWLGDEIAVADWLGGLLQNSIAPTDLGLLARLHEAWLAADGEAALGWSRYLFACRETAELRREDVQTGQALARVLVGLEFTSAGPLIRHPDASLALLFALAGVSWNLAKADLLAGYAWSWLENQVLCAIKLVPLGQAAGQRLLADLAGCIPQAVERALGLADDELGAAAPTLAIASSRHEMQYSRLFRS